MGELSTMTVDLRTNVNEGVCNDNDDHRNTKSDHGRSTQQADETMKRSRNNEDSHDQLEKLYDPPVNSSEQGKEQKFSSTASERKDALAPLEDDNDDNDSLNSLEQTQLGEDNNVTFVINLNDTRTQANHLPATRYLVNSMETIYNYVPSMDGLKNWLWGSQYERLLPDSKASGPRRRRLEGRVYESIAVEVEYGEERVRGDRKGQGGLGVIDK